MSFDVTCVFISYFRLEVSASWRWWMADSDRRVLFVHIKLFINRQLVRLLFWIL